MRFPIVASVFLFGFYILYKYVDKDLVNTIITVYFCIATVLSNAQIVEDYLPLPKSLKTPFIDRPAMGWMKSYLEV